MTRIVLLDPSLKDNQGSPSLNLGDIIIAESVIKELQHIFVDAEITRISSHKILEKDNIKLINSSDFCFIGGTNILSSDAMAFSLMPLVNSKLKYLFPKVKNLILMGVGWGFGYTEPVRFKTKLFYKNIFSTKFLHSCRDEYSAKKISTATFYLAINTCCPTTWQLKNALNYRKNKSPECLFTLTDYSIDAKSDSDLIKTLLDNFEKLVFFPQGSLDKQYLESLNIYKTNSSRFQLLPHDYNEFNSYVSSNSNITYAGTRLHAGIKCLQHGIDTLIIGVDNRALEIHKDTMLPIAARDNTLQIQSWLNGARMFDDVKLPFENIEKWRSQFH